MNTNLKHDSTESVKGTYDGVEVDFDRYNFVERTLSTKETSIVISYIEGDEEPIRGEQVAYGSQYDLDLHDMHPYLDYLIENNLFKREIPEYELVPYKASFIEVADYFNKRDDFNFYFYDGTDKPKKITDLNTLQFDAEYLHGTTDVTNEFREIFIEQMLQNKRAAEYQREQPFIDSEHELWINPTLKQLQEYNEMENLNPEDYLEGFKGYDHVIQNETLSLLEKELPDKEYLILKGVEILETLKEDFEVFNLDEISLEEWAKPVILHELIKESKYVVNGEISFKPINIETLLDERYGQSLPIDTKEIDIYLDNLMFTRKGIEQSELIDMNHISFYTFHDITDYLSLEEFESFNKAHEKITTQGVEVADSFIEIGIGNNEYYKNNSDFKTEKDILDYVNEIFDKEGIDIEAKTFDRLAILKEHELGFKELSKKLRQEEMDR